MKVYLDNAATTPMDKEVIEAIIPVMENGFGNPSSIHSFGRNSRAIIEKARKKVAGFINVSPGEIVFTGGGTEADNMVLRCAVKDSGVTHIITSATEHHAVIDTAEILAKSNEGLKLSLVKHDAKGYVDLENLNQLLEENKDRKTLVSLMHANNEIGNRLPLKQVSVMCRKYGAIFHSDTVQTMCHYEFDLRDLDIDFITCAAHKFHGPKGVGFLYVNSNVQIKPIITGGAQERNIRAGTENIIGIVGLAKAMEVAYRDIEGHQNHIQGIKTYMIEKLEALIPEVTFNGDPKGDSLYTVLNVQFPNSDMDEMLLYNFDIEGIAVSGGSACSSGSNTGSHVLRNIGTDMTKPSIRFSFSKYTTIKEIDYTMSVIEALFIAKTV
jgi:cysteine desulfurase